MVSEFLVNAATIQCSAVNTEAKAISERTISPGLQAFTLSTSHPQFSQPTSRKFNHCSWIPPLQGTHFSPYSDCFQGSLFNNSATCQIAGCSKASQPTKSAPGQANGQVTTPPSHLPHGTDSSSQVFRLRVTLNFNRLTCPALCRLRLSRPSYSGSFHEAAPTVLHPPPKPANSGLVCPISPFGIRHSVLRCFSSRYPTTYIQQEVPRNDSWCFNSNPSHMRAPTVA